MNNSSVPLAKRPCRKCRAVDRYPDGSCRPCNRQYAINWQNANPGKRRAICAAWQKRHPGKQREASLRYEYNLSREEYNAMLAAQGNACAICGRPETVVDKKSNKIRELAVDHDHSTGLIRWLLCDRCNRGIGLLKESPLNLRMAAAYLESHGTTTVGIERKEPGGTYSMATKKPAAHRRMSEKEIQNFESGNEEQILGYFAQLSGAQAGEFFIQLLRSYRDAARVANAAWLLQQEAVKERAPGVTGVVPDQTPGLDPFTWLHVRTASHERLKDALQTYAPMSFPPTQYAHDFAVGLMAGAHDTMQRFSSMPEALSWLGEYINRLRNARWFQGGNT